MKTNEKFKLLLMKDEYHFISLLFTLKTTRRAGGFHTLRVALTAPTLLRAKHSSL